MLNAFRGSEGHFTFSLVKSAFRIVAGCAMMTVPIGAVALAGALLAIAEVLGVVEELV